MKKILELLALGYDLEFLSKKQDVISIRVSKKHLSMTTQTIVEVNINSMITPEQSIEYVLGEMKREVINLEDMP